jgi:hypothetical protein
LSSTQASSNFDFEDATLPLCYCKLGSDLFDGATLVGVCSNKNISLQHYKLSYDLSVSVASFGVFHSEIDGFGAGGCRKVGDVGTANLEFPVYKTSVADNLTDAGDIATSNLEFLAYKILAAYMLDAVDVATADLEFPACDDSTDAGDFATPDSEFPAYKIPAVDNSINAGDVADSDSDFLANEIPANANSDLPAAMDSMDAGDVAIATWILLPLIKSL